jgi:hypothetical protein
MGQIKSKTVAELMDIANRFADGKMPITTREHGHPKMTGETGIATRGEDSATTTIMAPTIK